MKKSEIKTKIIDEEIINILFSIEENDLSPCDEPYSDDVYNQFKSDYIGKTIEDYCWHRYPDEPDTLLELVIEILNNN
jgi:hypothetical protein